MTNLHATHGEIQPTDEKRVTVEAIHQMALVLRSVWLALPVLALLVVIGLWWQMDHAMLLGWFLAAISMPLMRYWLQHRIFSNPPDFKSAVRWARQITLVGMLDGFVWGTAFIIFFIPDSVPEQVLFLSMLVTIIAGSIFVSSFWPAALLAFSIPALGLAAVPYIQQGTTVSYIMAGAMMVMLLSLNTMLQAAHRLSREAITLRFENSDLVDSLRVQKQVADDANLAKSKFLAAASHDLRQPIHAQGLFLEVLSRTEQTPHQQELVASARAASEASGELLNALLDFSRIEAGVIEPQLQPVRLQPLLNKIENELAPQADAKDIVYRSRETQAVVHTDPLLLELVLRNLVSNAIRYTDRGGVLVACRQHGTQAVLEVWDTGIGIAQEDQKEVFREFHQLGNPERDRRKGLGLGLAIADGLARALGHDLTLSSTPQCGSVFRLTLDIDNTTPSVQTNMTQSKSRLLNARLLVIDDDETVRAGMLHLLRDWGCECDAAESTEEAIALAQLHRPDVVISDYRLREQRTGVEAIAALRALLGASLPALLITGDTAPDRLREAKASGIPLLHKPVSPGKLYRRLVELQQEVVQGSAD
ncbi:MAG: response regulator [Nitrosomonadales bacterium]|nr:response regulator [Nitrosomonadales bacterium]